MTPEAQRIAIAEVCGYALIKGTDKWSRNALAIGPSYPPPNYLSDLNAMHEAESTLNWDEQASTQVDNYRDYLTKICGNDRALIPFATAAQRAEAFLRTINKWDDSK